MIVLTVSALGIALVICWTFVVLFLENVEVSDSPKQATCHQCFKPTYGIELEISNGKKLCLDCWEDNR